MLAAQSCWCLCIVVVQWTSPIVVVCWCLCVVVVPWTCPVVVVCWCVCCSCPVDKSCRSCMNISFRIGGPDGNEALEKKFIAEAAHEGMIHLSGHRYD